MPANSPIATTQASKVTKIRRRNAMRRASPTVRVNSAGASSGGAESVISCSSRRRRRSEGVALGPALAGSPVAPALHRELPLARRQIRVVTEMEAGRSRQLAESRETDVGVLVRQGLDQPERPRVALGLGPPARPTLGVRPEVLAGDLAQSVSRRLLYTG